MLIFCKIINKRKFATFFLALYKNIINQFKKVIMKKTLFLFFGLFFTLSLFAQSNIDEISIIQTSFGMEKNEIVKSFIKIPKDQTGAFWNTYNEYEAKRKELGKIRITLLTEYAEKWQNLKGEEADMMVKKAMDLNKKTDKLITTYYKKMKKATSIDVAVKFYEVETYIRATIHFYIKNTIPFVNQD